jgi:hypothetical protein
MSDSLSDKNLGDKKLETKLEIPEIPPEPLQHIGVDPVFYEHKFIVNIIEDMKKDQREKYDQLTETFESYMERLHSFIEI